METIDKSGTEDRILEDDGGKGDGTENSPDPKDIENEPKASGTTDPNGGEAALKDGEDAGAAPRKAGEEEGGVPGIVEFDPAQFEASILEKIDEKLKPKEEAPKQLTDEEWTGLEEKTGMARVSIQYIADLQAQMVDKIMASIEGKYGGRLAQFETGSALTNLSKEKGFSDASVHQKNVTEFLKDVDPRLHNDPNQLRKAVIYSRGLGISGTINKIRGEGSRGLKIVGAGRPTSPDGGTTGKSRPLNETERQAAQLMPGGEAEYIKIRNRNSNGAVTVGS